MIGDQWKPLIIWCVMSLFLAAQIIWGLQRYRKAPSPASRRLLWLLIAGFLIWFLGYGTDLLLRAVGRW